MTSDTSAFDAMREGQPYDPGDPDLVARRRRAPALMADYNRTVYGQDGPRVAILTKLLGSGPWATIRPPFYVDYGENIHLGPGVFLNYGCTLLDVCDIRIGARTQIGPHCQLLTADHPRTPEDRATGLEFGKPITIGEDVWLGGGVIVVPGITIGDGAIIGAGSVVTRDVAPHATVAGNPARALR